MDRNISGLYDLMILLSSLPNHDILILDYGICLMSDFYFGNFCFLYKPIPASEFILVSSILEKFYHGQRYQIYCTFDNQPFLFSFGIPIDIHPAMTYNVADHKITTIGFPVTKAILSDVDDIADFMIRYEPQRSRERMIEYMQLLISNKTVIFYIARYEGKLVGIRMIHYRETSLNNVMGYCSLVDTDYRRHGIATALLMEAMNDAHQNGIVTYDNQSTPSGYEFCKRFGCRQIGSYIYIWK